MNISLVVYDAVAAFSGVAMTLILPSTVDDSAGMLAMSKLMSAEISGDIIHSANSE